jgi:hypothetical protein
MRFAVEQPVKNTVTAKSEGSSKRFIVLMLKNTAQN